jgi:5-formaminoimidazole-4-carboxamide-1-beta-D-ribofuranosyl 5'-monophosphate synthetase
VIFTFDSFNQVHTGADRAVRATTTQSGGTVQVLRLDEARESTFWLWKMKARCKYNIQALMVSSSPANMENLLMVKISGNLIFH